MHPNHDKLLELTAQIVAAGLRALGTSGTNPEYRIPAIYAALAECGQDKQPGPVESPQPAVPVKKSVTPDAIISLEDGKPYRILKRHLTTLGMTPDEYRAKWGLPPDYPMVAPNYAAKRSALAKDRGLGRKRA